MVNTTLPQLPKNEKMIHAMFMVIGLLIVVSVGKPAVYASPTPHVNVSNQRDQSLAFEADPEIDPDAIIVMKEKTFHVIKGGKERTQVTDPHFSLMAGEYIWILLKNDDQVAHEFVSPLFRKVDLEFSGQASIIYTNTAAGVRVEPGQTVAIRFWLPKRYNELFYFWCNVHGKLHKDQMRGEIFILESTDHSK